MAELKTKRNLAIELLRVIATMMIILLHCLEHGKVASFFGFREGIALHYVKALCYGSLHLYGLITGYACINTPHRWSRIVGLWLQVVFYSLGIRLLDAAMGNGLSGLTMVTAILPITTNLYWYISSYFLLFCLIPFLNRLLQNLPKPRFQQLILLGFVLLSVMGWLADGFNFRTFAVNGGQSPIWLMYLYCVGAYTRLYGADFASWRKSICIAVFFAMGAITLVSEKFLPTISIGGLQFNLDALFWRFNAPNCTIGAIALFIAFANLKIEKCRVLQIFAPCCLGVYLLHDHPVIRAKLIVRGMEKCADMAALEALGYLAVFSLAVLLVCLLIDYARSLLFRLLHIPQLSAWSAERIRKMVGKIK